MDSADQVSGGGISVNVSSSLDEAAELANRSVTRRLTDILVEDRDADLLLQTSGREEGVIQWLRALDLQVTGACRADERLKPLLKLNVSAAMAEDGLLSHLSQVFMCNQFQSGIYVCPVILRAWHFHVLKVTSLQLI